MPTEPEQLAWSTGYYPLTGTMVHCPKAKADGARWNGVMSWTRNLYQDEIYHVEFLFLEGDMSGAVVTVNDAAAARKVVDCAPAWLYQKPHAPAIRREVHEEIVVFEWPPDQPVTHRLPPFVLHAPCSIDIRLDNVIAQDDPIGVVFLCRRPSEAELDRWRGRAR